jgi:AcrR family transcriptional regulator
VRNELVAAAEALLSEKGSVDRVTVADVVRRVGVTAPVLYAHFADKDALFVAVHAHRMNDFRDKLRRAARSARSPLEALELSGRAYIRYATTNPEAYMALFMTPSSLSEHDFFSDPAARTLTAYEDLVDRIRACIDSGEVAGVDAELVARTVWAQVHGLASMLITMPEIGNGVGRQRLVDSLLHAVTASLLALEPGP